MTVSVAYQFTGVIVRVPTATSRKQKPMSGPAGYRTSQIHQLRTSAYPTVVQSRSNTSEAEPPTREGAQGERAGRPQSPQTEPLLRSVA